MPKLCRVVAACVLSLTALLFLPRPAAAQTPTLAPQERLCDPAFQDCRADVLTYIQQEQVEIDMAFWMMTDARYSNALVAAWNRGVKIRLLMDPRCVQEHAACAAQNSQLQAAGLPMRNRITSGILHWKASIFVGQGQIEFAGANYAPFELTPTEPFVNYTDEIVTFTNTPSLVQSFMTKFDDMWVSTDEFGNYANITAPLVRSFPIYPKDPELNFPPDESYATRAIAAYNAEMQRIDVQMFRITQNAHGDAMLAAVRRGVPVRLITDETEYRNPERLWDAYNVDNMWANGVDVRFDGHQGIDHEKAVILYGTAMSIFGSSNWTDASDDSQREHNYFTTRSWIFDWLKAQFERKWYNETGYAETKPFVPLPPNTPVYHLPANGASAVAPGGVTLAWDAGLWAHRYDIYFGTSSNPPLLVANRNLGPSQSSGDDRQYGMPQLQPGTTYYWKIVSRTMAGVTAAGPIWSFTTAGTAPAPNTPPTVALTSPANGATVTAPASVVLTASAADSDGSIAKVDFFAGGVLVGSATGSPYTATWNGVAAGTYSLTAVATDDRNAATTSSAISLTVTGGGGVPPTLVRGPYLQQPSDHSMLVVWATREAGSASVRYGVGTAGPLSVAATSRLVPAATSGLGFDYYQHEATLAGLSPSTIYGYQAFLNGTAAAPSASFTTAPAAGSGTFSFVALGDTGTGSPEQKQIAGLLGSEHFDFLLHTGDIAYGSEDGTGDGNYATYQSFLFDIYPWLSSKPFVPVEGNHDSRPSNGNGAAYLDLFDLPTNGASAAFPDHAERYYSFDYGRAHFVALDTEFTFLDPARQAEQLRWLEADLAATHQPWKIVFFHRAPYSSGGEHGSSLDVRAAFGPLLERYGVDLVLNGHEHDYERTVPIRESTTPTDRAVPYIVTGGGGAPLYPAGTSSWTAFSASVNEYLKVTVDACRLTTTAIGLDGTPLDSSAIDHCTAPVVTLTSPAAGTTLTAPATVTLTANASDPDGTVAKVDFYANSTLVGTSTAAPYSATLTAAPAGTYTLTAVATDNVGATTTSTPVTLVIQAPAPPPNTLPGGWSDAEVGSTGAAGSASYSSGTFTVTGAGADVWNTADAFHYAYRTLDGDGSIVAHVSSIQNVANWTKAGVMIRGSISPSSAQAFMLVSWAKGVAFQRRLTDSAASVSTSGSASTAPRWVKLTRTGSVIAAFESADGVTWTQVASDTFVMGPSALVGLAVSSHVNGSLATALFDSVVVTPAGSAPNAPPAINLTSPVTGASFTAPAAITLAATATDSDGTVKSVAFYAGATLLGTSQTAPFTLAWSSVPAGSYTLTAVATDDGGAKTTSAPVSVTVNPPAAGNVAPTVALTSPADGSTATAPATIAIAANASDSDGHVVKVDFFASGTLIGSSNSSPYGVTWSNVAAGSYSLTAVATDDGGAVTTSAARSITISPATPPPGLPSGWSAADVGTTGAVGSTTYSGGTFTVTGAGADVWNNADAFQYAYTTLNGDGTIVAHVASIQSVANWTKAGVMIRGSTSPSSAQAFMLVSWAKGVAFQRRLTDGAASVSTSGSASTAPRWVRLTRTGNVITASESADGITWSTVSSDTFVMGPSTVIGIAVSSHVNGTLATATFDSVTVTPAGAPPANVPPSVSLTSPLTGASAVAPATVTVSANASDSDGHVVKVDFFAGATLLGTSTSAPYGVTWANVPAGSYTLTAVATDDGGATTTSSPVSITVTGAANVAPTVSLTSPAGGTTATAPASISLAATASDPDGTIARVQFFAGSTLVGTATTAPYAATWSGVAAGTYSLVAIATDNGGAATTSSAVSITVAPAPPPPNGLPDGWNHGDIGSVPFAGTATFNSGTYTVTGSGVDVWGTADQFHYAYRPLTGDGTITARVASIQNVAVWVKAGLMIRESLDQSAAHAFILVSSAKGVAFQRRDATGGISVNTAGSLGTAPRWVRLTRSGNTFSAYESADGLAWTLVGTDTIPMAGTVYIGLGVTSHTTSSPATCTFDNVSIQ